MELQIWSCCKNTLNFSSNATDKPLFLQTLASVRSLIINPSTSDTTISGIFETLTRSFQLTNDPLVLRHVLKLLCDLALHRTHLAQLIFKSIGANSSLLTESTRLAAESLSVLVLIAECDQALVSAMDEFGDSFFVSLCFRPSVSVRSWLLTNFDRYRIRPYLLLTVLLGFTKDPYPHVRRVALDGLVKLSQSIVWDDRGVIEGCYCRAVELLQDMDDSVRSAAVRAASGWWQVLVGSNQDEDALFVLLCPMVRDMCKEVRIEALDALGKIEMVSDDILLQTLSKKVLGSTKEKKSRDNRTMGSFEISVANGAGAFVHGLEDEFYEVRRSACRSLRILTILSAKFAGEVLNLLMDMLNDDSMVVRLEALEVMHHMATTNCLKVQETHMHMFLGTLVDNDTLMRSAARKILRLVKLPSLDMFKLSLDGLIENMEIYPQDEADVFSVLFNIGQRHGKLAICIVKEFYQEIESPCLNSARVAAFLMLAIPTPLSHDQHSWSIPPRIYSYAATLLGKFSHALSDIMDQNTLLAYLSWCSKSTGSDASFKEEGSFLDAVKADSLNSTTIEISSTIGESLRKISDGPYGIQSQRMSEIRKDMHTEMTKYMKLFLSNVEYMWPLIQSGHEVEVLRALRICKEELATFTTVSLESAGILAFVLQYLQVVKLITKVWMHFLPKRKVNYHGMGELDLVLEKLDRNLREMGFRFVGLSEDEELHVLELVLLNCILRLSELEVCCHRTTLKKLSTTVSRIELLHKEGSVEPSKFFIELKKSLCKIDTNGEEAFDPFLFKESLQFFSLKQFVFCGRFKHLKAELEVPDNDSENSFPFISGLPVGIPCKITLYNILSKNRLWLRMTLDEVKTQFVYLDLNQCEGSDEVRNITYTVPFYNTPKAFTFTLKVSLGMECLSEPIHPAKGLGRPRHELTYLCQDVEVYLSVVTKE